MVEADHPPNQYGQNPGMPPNAYSGTPNIILIITKDMYTCTCVCVLNYSATYMYIIIFVCVGGGGGRGPETCTLFSPVVIIIPHRLMGN